MPTLYEKIERLFDDGKLDTTYPPSVYEAYLKAQGLPLSELKWYPTKMADMIASYYVGYYSNRRDFIDVYITDICGVQIPSTLTVDYNTTWEADLRHSYAYVPDTNEADGEGWYFQRH